LYNRAVMPKACRWLVLSLILLPVLQALAHGTDPGARQLLTDAAALVDLRCSAGASFELIAEFTAQTAQPRSGHLTLRWAGDNLWSEDILAGDYSEHDVRKGDSVYIDRNAPFTPVFVSDIRDLLIPLCGHSTNLKLKTIAPRTFGSKQAHCLEATISKGDRRNICIDPDTKELVSITMPDHTPPQEDLFSAYEPFGSLRFPRHLQRYWKDKQTLDLKVVLLQQKSFDADLFSPRPNSIAWRVCANKTPPRLLRETDAPYPPEARDKHVSGTVSLSVTVLPDGSVDNVQFVQRLGYGLDEAAEKTVKGYKFKPAMCGSEPVATAIAIEVEFKLP